ncbi:hypothetical protein [Streptomyces sp. A-14]|uniref:hypothetical protein n=1 Tax=Streptomyces sp. A-14 TaxID=3127467 RepID=UPI003EBBE3BC
MGATVHVIPLNDLVEHDTDSEEPSCVCGPNAVPIEVGGVVVWAYVHASLDGRELAEEVP